LAGSYYVESLTDAIEEDATRLFNKVMSKGGSIQAINSRFYTNELTRTAYQDLKDVASGKRIVVGVNKYQVEETNRVKPLKKVTFEEEESQIRRLQELRRSRDNARVQKSLIPVKEAALEGTNTVEPILEAVEAYATIGEICQVLSDVWGRYQQPGI
jgi:methylmalonyl-CoA mutase, N-terminal domain